jgi:hypothetical protein
VEIEEIVAADDYYCEDEKTTRAVAVVVERETA